MSLKITARDSTTIRIYDVNQSGFDTLILQYNENDYGWDSYSVGDEIYLSPGGYVEFKNYSGTMNNYNLSPGLIYRLESTGQIDVSGDLASMIQGDWEDSGDIPPLNTEEQTFAEFFKDCPIVDASGLKIEFSDCSLNNAFRSMFEGCQYLEKGPNIAVSPVYMYSGAFNDMFFGCTQLREITYGADQLVQSESWMANAGLYGGEFYYTRQDFDTNSIQWGTDNGLPNNWTISYRPESIDPDYFSIMSLEDAISISFSFPEEVGFNVDLEYRIMFYDQIWQDWQHYPYNGSPIYVDYANMKVQFRNTTRQFSYDRGQLSFNSTGKVAVSGELYTLLDYTDESMSYEPSPYAFANLFSGCDVVYANELKLFPINVQHIYQSMFKRCSNLKETPEIDFGVSTEQGCYQEMFSECTSLVRANHIAGYNHFAESACESMFYGCTDLIDMPLFYTYSVGPAAFANMFNGCINLYAVVDFLRIQHVNVGSYRNMFKNCSSITSVPRFEVNQASPNCFEGMFEGCTSLTEIPALTATILAESCYQRMFADCTGISSISFYEATRQPNCYKQMFDGCTSLNRIEFNAKSLNEAYNESWLRNVAQTGTFIYSDSDFKPSSVVRNESGIPAGWSIRREGSQPSLTLSINGKPVSSLTIDGKNVSLLR